MESLLEQSCTNGSHFTLSLCVLNQWSLDFTGNTNRIIESIEQSKRKNARYRLGPELEISGYGCEDHFHEPDTFIHSWQCLAKILEGTKTKPELQDIVCDIGMPVLFSGVSYNCRVIILNGQILLIRPKLVLADGGLHRETRWFTAWAHPMQVVSFPLPSFIQSATMNNQKTTIFGDALLYFYDDTTNNLGVKIGIEICEELWIGCPPHIKMYASGVDVVLNASASHHELRKLDRRIELVKAASRANGCGGLYAYTNLLGCDSERICYDGCALAAVSGQIINEIKQFGLGDVHVQIITVDVNAIRSKRVADRSFGRAASAVVGGIPGVTHTVIDVKFSLCHSPTDLFIPVNRPITNYNLLKPEEEISQGPSLWLWDMLRRSKSSGFFLCLSGGLDSASVACLVFYLCVQVYESIKNGSSSVLKDCIEILGETSNFRPQSPRELCNRLLTTCYLGTENSSTFTRLRAQNLSKALGSNFLDCNINTVVSEFVDMATRTLKLDQKPRYSVHGGTNAESLALQNVQARSRNVSAYLLSQLIAVKRNLRSGLLVLSSANLDEGLRGYLTKYDCSSADLNPIGSISKFDLRNFIIHCANHLPAYCHYYKGEKNEDNLDCSKLVSSVLLEILEAPPTAELMPLDEKDGHIKQTDESDMGITYCELSLFGKLRKISKCGPFSLFQTVLNEQWTELIDVLPTDCLSANNNNDDDDDRKRKPTIKLGRYLADKVKLFFKYYAINRHKITVLPPAYHTEAYNTDDNRFDLRPFLYPTDWNHQFKCIDILLAKWESQFDNTISEPK